MSPFRFLCASLLGLLSASVSAQAIISTFDNGNEGWTVTNCPYNGHVVLTGTQTTLALVDAEGNPAPSLRTLDLYGETGFSAPAAFLGNRLGWFGGWFSYDMKIRFTDNLIYPAVWLIGANKTLVYNIPALPLVDIWLHQTFQLKEVGWHLNGWQGPVATRGDVMEVLSDLRGILINAEWRSGPDDTNLDNVVMEPPTTGVVCQGEGCRGSLGRWSTTWVSGTTLPGSTVRIEVTDGVPNSMAAVLLGVGPANVPLFGCTAWIVPSSASIAMVLDGTGAAGRFLTIPNVGPGVIARLQSVSLDPAAPGGQGLTLSNGVLLLQ